MQIVIASAALAHAQIQKNPKMFILTAQCPLFLLYTACSIIPIRGQGVRRHFPKKNNKVAYVEPENTSRAEWLRPAGLVTSSSRFLLSSLLPSALNTLANIVFPGCLFQAGCAVGPYRRGESVISLTSWSHFTSFSQCTSYTVAYESLRHQDIGARVCQILSWMVRGSIMHRNNRARRRTAFHRHCSIKQS